MAKKTKASGQPPLSHYWTPPAAVLESGLGEPWACLATTYEFDAEFFESELLPRFLGLKFDQTENEPSFLVEREEALALARVAVFVDHSRFDSSQTTLRWDQVPIQIPGGIQHAKIVVLAWENFIRVMIGSANLKRVAYRRNREMFAALDFWNSPESLPLGLLRETLDVLSLILSWSRSSAACVDRTRETIARLRRHFRGWTDAPQDFTARERPRAALTVTHPRTENRPARSALDDVFKLWGNRRATSITVVTPFTATEPHPNTGDPVVRKLGELLLTRECEGWLVLPELPRTPKDPKTRLPFPDFFKTSWKGLFESRGGGYVLPVPLCVEGKEDRNRTLHTKCLILENINDDVALMMIGSSNFTPRGLGVGFYNFEANVVFEDTSSAKRNGLCLIDRLGLPRTWDEGLDLDEAQWQTSAELPEDEPDPRPALPAFFSWATFSQITGELKLGLDRNRPEPAAWSIRLPGAAADAPILFAHHFAFENPSAETLTHIFPETMHAANIVAVLVEWHDDQGGLQQAKLGVTVESEEHLLPPEQFQKLNADAIIECLISGKTPAQWFDQIHGKKKSASGSIAAIESLRSVDTSSFLLYRIRRFGRALTGMSQRIMRTLAHPDALNYRLFKDPFGPLSLARSIACAPEGEQAGWYAKLEDEHRLFLLAEILLTVAHLGPRIVRTVKGKERKQIEDVFSGAIQELELLSGKVADNQSLPENLRNYWLQVLLFAVPLDANVAEVQHDH